MRFIDRLLPAPRNGGFQMDDYWVWCASAIKAENPGEDGRYHLFASRWPRSLTFSGHWITNSEVVRAVSDTPEGPYQFADIALPWRHRRYFDGLVTHNPVIKKFDGCYYLFYIGITYDFDIPTPERQIHESKYPEHQELYRMAWNNKRIGVATAQSVLGPWRRPDRPLIEPRPGKWDELITSNPSVAIRDDGTTSTHGNFERPNLLIQDGRPTHLFAAISAGPEMHWQSSGTRSVCIPLRAS